MAYTPKEWQDGELFDAEGANHIEQGIATAQETADEALAGGGGSGGDYASKEHYGDDHISVGRLEGSDVGKNSIAFGTDCVAGGYNSQAMGEECVASEMDSHAEGCETTASDAGAHAEGYQTTASAMACHAEGWGTSVISDSNGAHAEGVYNEVYGLASHAEGGYCQTTKSYSHAGGYYAQANNYAAFACGKFNKEMEGGGGGGNTVGDVFAIGNGTSSYRRGNAFRVTYTGEVYALSAFNASGADYAEFVKEWADGNPDGEDRVGYFVTVRDGYLCKADAGDYIVGVTSGNPSVIGNSDEDYHSRYERDVFGRLVYEDAEEEVTEWSAEEKKPIIKKTGNIIKNGKIKHAADYDAAVEYVHRKDRPEWDYVGMIGVIPVRDDGTCQAGQFCRCADGGIAAPAEQRGFDTWMVLERVSENVVKIIMR